MNKKTVYKIIFILALGIALLAVAWLIRYAVVGNQAEQLYTQLQEETAISATEEENDSTQQSGEQETEAEESVDWEEEMLRSIDFAQLQEETNEDIYAWIYIPDTVIDYPVLQHPTDNSYYLDHNLNGSQGYPACIYTELENARDFSDFNTILYGHNMKNGTMFKGLHSYKDENYMAEHPYVYIYLEGLTLKYQIFAAYQYSDAHLLYAFDYSTEEGRQSYLDEIFSVRTLASVFDSSVEVTTDSQIITLSTCVGSKASARFLVQAVLVASYSGD